MYGVRFGPADTLMIPKDVTRVAINYRGNVVLLSNDGSIAYEVVVMKNGQVAYV